MRSSSRLLSHLIPLLLPACVAALTACNEGPAYGTRSDAGAADAPPDASPSAHHVCDVTFGAVLRSFESCCSVADRKTPLYRAETTGAPRVRALGTCEEDLAISDATQRVRFDAAKLAECARDVDASLASAPQCWRIHNRPPRGPLAVLATASCAAAVVGLQEEGKPCRRDYECIGGLTCVGWSIDTDGACHRPPAIDDACGRASVDAGTGTVGDAGAPAPITNDYAFGDHPACAANAFCDGHCKPMTESDAGSVAAEGDVCTGDADCLEGLYCSTRTSASARYCMPRGAAGTRCDPADVDTSCKGSCAVNVATCASFCGSH